jgi:UDP-N-acetylmuramate dehydrogenase
MMNETLMPVLDLQQLRAIFGDRMEENVSLARFTSARVGGNADAFLTVESGDEMVSAVAQLWDLQIPFIILGGGSNMLISDRGVSGVVLNNRARSIRFSETAEPPVVWAESGANFGLLARQAQNKGLGGLEWAAGIPGTVGGAVVGNAGANSGDMAGSLRMAEILHRNLVGQPGVEDHEATPGGYTHEIWPVERFAYHYRTSILKRNPGEAVVISAVINLEASEPDKVRSRIDPLVAHRRKTQPPGASMGSMFKNPPDDYAGRLIEAVGLKGARVGQAQISLLHANFFINLGGATASEILNLIQLAQDRVEAEFGITLELEIELVGEW